MTAYHGVYDLGDGAIKYFNADIDIELNCPYCDHDMTFNVGDEEYLKNDHELVIACYACEEDLTVHLRVHMPVVVDVLGVSCGT